MAERTYMDVRSRIATCLLLKKLDMNKVYSQKIGVQDSSHYRKSANLDKNEDGACSLVSEEQLLT